jgi:hypothetical protein
MKNLQTPKGGSRTLCHTTPRVRPSSPKRDDQSQLANIRSLYLRKRQRQRALEAQIQSFKVLQTRQLLGHASAGRTNILMDLRHINYLPNRSIRQTREHSQNFSSSCKKGFLVHSRSPISCVDLFVPPTPLPAHPRLFFGGAVLTVISPLNFLAHFAGKRGGIKKRFPAELLHDLFLNRTGHHEHRVPRRVGLVIDHPLNCIF